MAHCNARRDVPQVRGGLPPPCLSRNDVLHSALFAQNEACHTLTPASRCPLETFVSYGLEFQRRFVPNLEERTAVLVRQTGDAFEVTCADGDTIRSRKVILASGILHFSHIPAELRDLPAALISHGSDHHDLSCFNGQEVVVIGAGGLGDGSSCFPALRRGLGHGGCAPAIGSVPDATRGSGRLSTRSGAPMTVVGPGWKSVFLHSGASAVPLYAGLVPV